MSQAPVAIIGAGFAGLTAAAFLRRQGIPVVIYEASDHIAGLAATEIDEEGFAWDFGAHFITNRLAAAIGVAARTRTVERYGEAVWLDGAVYRYPLGLLREPSFVLSAIGARARHNHSAPRSAADVLRVRYGWALCRRVAIPLLEAWSGRSATTLAPAVVDKFQHGVAETVWLTLDGRLQHRAIAIGYSHEMPENPSVWHVYPIGGVRVLCDALARGLEDSIRLRTPVERIHVDGGRAVAVEARGVIEPVSAVVSTAPVHILARIVTGTSALAPLARFRYRPMVFVNLRFRGRGLLPDTMVWFPDRRPFFRLTEVPISLPWLAPDGKTSITADLGCEVGDAIWAAKDDALGELCVSRLEDVIPDARARYLGCRVSRTAIAYPLLLRDYEAERRQFERSTGVSGLYSIGRNGEFAHLLMEDVYWRTIRQMRDLAASYTSRAAAMSSIARPSDLNTIRPADGAGRVPATISPSSA
jgi:protoporphyrinogen/coproporphyrinogen III oxidase